MNFKLLISPVALSETDDAYLFYERISKGLGERFLKSLEDMYKKLSQTPKYYGYISGAKDLRDVKMKDFPFVVVFQIVNDQVLILRVFNTSHDPFSFKNL